MSLSPKQPMLASVGSVITDMPYQGKYLALTIVKTS